MDVDSLSDAHRHPPRNCSAARRSAGVVILTLCGVARDDAHGRAQQLDQCRVVGRLGTRCMGPPQEGGVEGLRCLHGHQLVAVEGVDDHARHRPA